MKKRFFISRSIWLLFFVAVLTPLFYTVPVSASIITVPQDYLTIQEAVDAARKNDIIQVSPGVYYENVYITQQIELIGANKTTTIIDGQQIGDVISVEKDAVTITGFTIRNGDNGIRVMGSIGSINITDNIIEDNRYGVSFIGNHVSPTTDNIIVNNTFRRNSNVGVSITTGFSNTIFQNDISGSAYGMKLISANTTTISDNLLTDDSYGIYLSLSGSVDVINNTVIDNSFGIYAAHSDNILIHDNQVSGSTYAIELYDSYSSTILHNTVLDNPTYSVYIVYSHSNDVTNNTVSRSDWGVTLYNSSLNTFEGNTISHNTFGITTAISSNNIIYHNNFINNVDQITRDFPSINTWSQGGEGNYWSTYQGEDDGSGGRVAMDGIGDTLIPHQGVDFYPLMQTYGNILGDVNVDGIVDIFDIGYISAHWYPGPPMGPLGYDANADINYDGTVDIFDIGICSSHIGETA